MKTKTYNFKEFMEGEHKKVKTPTVSLIPLATAPLWTSIHASASTTGEQVMTAFSPLFDLVQSFAYPIAMVVVLAGSLFVMIGNSDKGFTMISRAAGGYVLCMFLPMIFNILVDVMAGVV